MPFWANGAFAPGKITTREGCHLDRLEMHSVVVNENTEFEFKLRRGGAICCKIYCKRWVLKGLKAAPPRKLLI